MSREIPHGAPPIQAILDRMARESAGISEEEFARYVSQHVAVGVAFMRGAMGEEWTRQFLMDVFAATSNGTDTFTHPLGRKFVVPREPNCN